MDGLLKKIYTEDYCPTDEEINLWQEQYPYCVIPQIALLKHNDNIESQRRQALTAYVAMHTSDLEELGDLIGEDRISYADFYPESGVATKTTDETINSFLDTFAPVNPHEEEMLSKVLFSPVADYASMMAVEEKQSKPTEAELDEANVSEAELRINRFIAMEKGSAPPDENDVKSEKSNNLHSDARDDAEEVESSKLTESFAKIMIKNGNYRKALEIITDLSLNNPEKSIYFADQMRFLRKLIINENN